MNSKLLSGRNERGCETLAPSKTLFSICLLCLSQISYSLGFAPGTLICMVISGIAVFFCTRSDGLFLLLFLLPSNRILTVGPMSVLSIIFIAYVLRHILFSPEGKGLNQGMVCLSFVLLLYSCVQSVFDGTLAPLLSTAKILVALFAVVDMLEWVLGLDSLFALNEILAFGVIISFGINVVLSPNLLLETARLTVGNENGQNVLGITCSFSLCILLFKTINERCSKKDVLLVISLLAIGIMTGSRSFAISLVIGIIFIVLNAFANVSLKSFARLLIVAGIVILMGAVVLRLLPQLASYLTVILERIMNPRNGDISNNRFEIWEQYFVTFLSNPGFLLLGSSDLAQYNLTVVGHNFIIEQLASYGVTGSIVILCLYSLALSEVFHSVPSVPKEKPTLGSLAPLAVLISASCFSHTLLGIPQTTMLFVGVIFAVVAARRPLSKSIQGKGAR